MIVLGKHLCGLGTDLSIDFIARNRGAVHGCVFATCCCNKISEDVGLFVDLYGLHESDGAVVSEIARTTSWRNTSKATSSLISEPMLRKSEYCESIFSSFRKQKLQKCFEKTTEIQFCDDGTASQQNRCLVGESGDASGGGDSRGNATEEEEVTKAFFSLLRCRIALLSEHLPIDMRFLTKCKSVGGS